MDVLQRIEMTVPDQPPTGSVVLDKSGRAWQRNDERAYGSWHGVKLFSLTGDGSSWASLLLNHGPVTVVHRAEPTS